MLELWRASLSRPSKRLAAIVLPGLLLVGCLGDQSPLLPASSGSEGEIAPRISTVQRASDQEHQRLLAAFGGEYRAPRARAALDEVVQRLAKAGEGPPIVRTANWFTHLELDWESAIWRHWFEALADGRTLVRYDPRGSGLSDRNVDDFSLETWIRDLEAVVDAVGLQRFPLIGLCQGGAVAVAFAARHPERVSRLVLYDSYLSGAYTEGVDQRIIETRQLEEVSIGDYILSGGEPAALVLLDAVVRLLPGVMGNEASGTEESFEHGLLEHPHYTRPQEFEGRVIPEVLTSGNHARIAAWRRAEAERFADALAETADGVFQAIIEGASRGTVLPPEGLALDVPALAFQAGDPGSRALRARGVAQLRAVLSRLEVVAIPRTGHDVLRDDPVAYRAAVARRLDG